MYWTTQNKARIFARSKLSPEITGERFDLHSRKNTTFSMRRRDLKKKYIIPVKEIMTRPA